MTERVKQEGRYVYGVIPCGEKRSFGKIGINGNEVYTMPHKDISAVVDDIIPTEYDPDETKMLAHFSVIERLMQKYTVIPVAYGSAFLREDRVNWMLATLYNQLKDYLGRLENKVEMGLKVFWDPEDVKREVEEIGGKIEELTRDIAASRPQDLGEATKKILDTIDDYKWGREWRGSEDLILKCCYAEKIHDTLRKLPEDTRISRLIGDKMILNESFLIYPDKVKGFEEELEKIRDEYVGRGLEFQLSGPFAPFNFACIYIRSDGRVELL
ncbi:MAG: GvpL/GvpF family gas vesicle protein [Candidatus Bathyarchaeia archaeon]